MARNLSVFEGMSKDYLRVGAYKGVGGNTTRNRDKVHGACIKAAEVVARRWFLNVGCDRPAKVAAANSARTEGDEDGGTSWQLWLAV
jgi:hypothetical protein